MTFSYVKTYKTAIQLKIQNISINAEVSRALFKSVDPRTPRDDSSDLQRRRLVLPVLELRIKRILQSSCVPSFFHSACFWDSPMLLNVSTVCSFLLLRSMNRLPFVYSFCSTGMYLGYFYLGAITNKVFEWKYSSSLEKYLGVRLLDHRVVIYLILLENVKVLQSEWAISYSHEQFMKVVPYPLQHLVL